MSVQAFGKYVVVRRLGSGGMAEVYEARDPLLDRRVAIKAIYPHFAAQPGFKERFLREAKLIADLRHPHIVQLYDFDLADGQPFMVMEYLEGGTLQDRLAEQRARGATMPLGEAARLLQALASALDYAHAHGAVHRDIKPANILFTMQGDPVLTDFGIVKLLDTSVQLSATGSVMGTPAYMSPEQAAGNPVDARSDQYSLGVVLYEMTTGRVPFEGESLTGVLMKHLTEPPPPPRTFNPNLPEPAEAVILKALAKNPAERFPTAGDLARAFDAALRGEYPPAVGADAATLIEAPRPIPAPPSAIRHPPSAIRRPPSAPARLSGKSLVILGAAAFAVVVLIVGLMALFGGYLPPAQPPGVPTIAAWPSATAVALIPADTPTVFASATHSPTAIPSSPTLLPATPTRAIAPGVYVTGLRLSPPAPKRGEGITFFVTFLNAFGQKKDHRWRVEIWRLEETKSSFGVTDGKQPTIAPGTSELATFDNWKLTGGGPCESFRARVIWEDESQHRTPFTQPDGAELWRNFQVCP